MRRHAPALAAPLAAALWAGPACADQAPPRLTLDWSSSPACSSDARVLEEVARILVGASPVERRVGARVRLARTDRGRWKVHLVTEAEGTSRSRSFDAESCEAAASGVAFILALAVDPAVAAPARVSPVTPGAAAPGAAPADTSSPPTPGAPPAEAVTAAAPAETPTAGEPGLSPTAPAAAPRDEPDRPAPPAPPSIAPPVVLDRSPAPPPSPAGPSHPSMLVAAAAAADTGTLPRSTPGVVVAVGLQPWRWRIELAGGYWSPQSGTVATGGAGARFQAFSVEARAAYGWPLGPFAVGPVAAAGLEAINASGFGGASANHTGTWFVGTVGGGGSAAWRWGGNVGLRLEILGEVPLSRPSFVATQPAPLPSALVLRPAPVAGRALLGADILF